MTLAIYNSAAFTNASGVAVAPNADVEVRRMDTGALATLWSDEAGTVPLANPATALADANGRFQFYAAGIDRGYSVKVTKGADTYTLPNQAIGTAAQLDQSAILLQATMTTKGDVIVATGAAASARKGAPANGYARVANSAASDGWTDAPFQSKNLLINPNWQIDQINEGALYTINAAGPIQGPDGWSGSATGGGVFKLRTLADPDNAALKCLEITCTTADAAIAATDNYYIFTAVEGYDAAALKAGTAAPETITIQFKFKTNITGVYGVSVANSATNRSYVGTITVAGTTEAEYTVTLTMDTTGTWLYTNGVGLYARIALAAGSNFQAAAGSWGATNMFSTSSQCNFMSANTNVAYLKRIQLVAGSSPQAYTPADLQKELAKAQRYYQKSWQQGTAVLTATSIGYQLAQYPAGSTIANNEVVGCVRYPVVLRAAPTLTIYPYTTPSNTSRVSHAGLGDQPASSGTTGENSDSAHTVVNSSGGAIGATGGGFIWHYTANARLA